MRNVTKGAATRAQIAKDHEGCGPASEALRQVRAGGFFANAVKMVSSENLLNLANLLRVPQPRTNP